MMPPADTLRTLVAGGGQAGGQFLRAMRYGQCSQTNGAAWSSGGARVGGC